MSDAGKAAIPSPAGDLPPEAAPLCVAELALAARDIDKLAAFYTALLGAEPVADDAVPGALRFDLKAAALRLLPSPGAAPGRGNEPGLFHTAFLLPDRAALAGWLHHALGLGLRLQGASDHGVSDALYLSDPEGNGIEVYADRPRDAWPRDAAGGLAMMTERLDLQALLSEAPGAALDPAQTRIGHVHLRAGDLAATEAFYRALGLEVTQRVPKASWLGSGGYHHHLALNAWNSAGMRPAGLGGLAWLSLRATEAAAERQARAALLAADPAGGGREAHDPSGNLLRLETAR
ncbi:VOC family protein [Teichococcus oryzae]|nr:VOC family protein [Pseudoroseomonas oryzae]